MTHVKTEVRRLALMAAARDVFQEAGFDQASMEQIAARAGGSKATLYRYFASKEDLFTGSMQHAAGAEGGGMMALLHRSGGAGPDLELTTATAPAAPMLDPNNPAREA